MFAVTFYRDDRPFAVYDELGIGHYAIYETASEACAKARKWNAGDPGLYHVVPAEVLYDIEMLPPTRPSYKVRTKRT